MTKVVVMGFGEFLSTCEVSSKSVYASRSFGLITHANGKTKKRQKTNKASVTNDTQITHKKIDDRTFHTFCYPLVWVKSFDVSRIFGRC